MLYIYTQIKKQLEQMSIETSVLFSWYVGKTFHVQLKFKAECSV